MRPSVRPETRPAIRTQPTAPPINKSFCAPLNGGSSHKHVDAISSMVNLDCVGYKIAAKLTKQNSIGLAMHHAVHRTPQAMPY